MKDELPDTDMEACQQHKKTKTEKVGLQDKEHNQCWGVSIQNSCPISLGAGFFGALEDRGIIEIDNCKDIFLAECVVDRFREDECSVLNA